MHQKVIATRSGRYGTRMLAAGDEMTLSGPRARILIALGRAAPKPIRRARKPVEPEVVWTPAPALEAEVAKKPRRKR